MTHLGRHFFFFFFNFADLLFGTLKYILTTFQKNHYFVMKFLFSVDRPFFFFFLIFFCFFVSFCVSFKPFVVLS